MKRKITVSIFIILSVLIISCNYAAKKAESPQKNLEQIMSEMLGENAVSQKNSSETFALCSKGKAAKEIHFFIYDLQSNKVIFKDIIQNGTVEWKSRDEIKVKMTPGMITTDPEENKKMMGYVYNVRTQKKLIP